MKRIDQTTGVVTTMAIGIFLCMLDTTVMNIALPAIQTGLKTSLGTLSWALNIYTVLFASLTIPLGRLADIWGRSRVYVVGLGLFLLGSLCSGLAPSVTWLIMGRSVQSVGAAIVFPASMTIGIQSAALAQRTRVIAILGVTQGLAAALGPTIGGIVMQFWGWRGIFLINVPLILIAGFRCLRQLDLTRQPRQNEKLDSWGSLLSMVVLFSLTLVLVKGSDWGWQSGAILGLIGLCVVALVTFIIVEQRVSDPMVPMALFKDRQFVGAAIVTVISGIFLVALMVLMPSFFTKVLGKSGLMAALMITPASVMIFICSPISGLLLAKVGPRLVIGLGALAMISGYVVLSMMTPSVYWQFLMAALLIGTGYGIIIGPITILAAGQFTGKLLTASQSVIGVFRQIGTSLAVAIFVSALSTNLVTAKQHVWDHARTTIIRLDVPQVVKQTTLKKVKAQLATEATPHQPREPVINDHQAAELVQATYQQVLVKKRLQTQSARVKKGVYQQVHQQVIHKVTRINQQVMHSISVIHRNVRDELTRAFIKPYQRALPFTFLLLATVVLFRKREQENK